MLRSIATGVGGAGGYQALAWAAEVEPWMLKYPAVVAVVPER